MLTKYLNNPEYDLAGSFVIGDRPTDVELAKNLGCRAIYLQNSPETLKEKGLEEVCALATTDWDQIAEFLFAGERKAEVRRTTKETDIDVVLNLDGNGTCDISTGLGFFDHMLEQIGKHSGMDLTIRVKGDLEVDEHHTIEDTAIALGECINQALGSKRGIERYGYALPMDDCLCQVCLDFGGRPWLVWDAEFKREKIGEMPTEMFLHFFKSLSDAAKMNLNIKAEGQNEHHKIEGIFKALARALKMADQKIEKLKESNAGLLEDVERMKPKEIFADAVSASTSSILIGDLAKLLRQNGVDTGQKRLFEQLRNEGYLMKTGSSRNMPTQRYVADGLFQIKETVISNPDGSVRMTKTTKVTGKGQQYFLNKYLKKEEAV